MNDIIQKCREYSDYFIRVRRDLHQIPEIAFEEIKTSEYIKNQLKAMGIAYSEAAKTGICAVIYGGSGEKTLGIRADMDALSVCEETGLSFSSRHKNMMHACGHDMHMAALLGAGKILNEMRDKLRANVKLIFQPAEEDTGGALPMIEEGVLENPKVDAMLAAHVWPGVPCGSVELKCGGATATPDEFRVEITGVGGHGAYPHQNINPVALACRVACAFESIVNTTDPFEPLVVCVTGIHGGQSFNVVPERAELFGTVRVIDRELRARLPKLMEDIAGGIVFPHGGKLEFQYKFMYPPMVNDPEVTNAFAKSAGEILGGENVLWSERASMVGEDFAYFGEKVPSSLVRLGCGDTEVLHSPRFSPDEGCLETIVKCFVKFALDFC